MKKNYYQVPGLPLLRFPITKNDKVNTERRNIIDLGAVTSSQMVSETDIHPDAPMVICGRYSKAIPILRQLIRQSGRPFVLIRPGRDLSEESVLLSLPYEWYSSSIHAELPQGNGVISLSPGAQTILSLKENIPAWDTHLVILCPGSGLQLDQELLNLLNGLGSYMILSESLPRSLKRNGDQGLSPSDLFAGMEYILVTSIGTSARDLISILPAYKCEKTANSVNVSLHRHGRPFIDGTHIPQNGGGLHMGQTRTLETEPILSQDDLIRMQEQNTLLIHNARSSHTWTARITR